MVMTLLVGVAVSRRRGGHWPGRRLRVGNPFRVYVSGFDSSDPYRAVQFHILGAVKICHEKTFLIQPTDEYENEEFHGRAQSLAQQITLFNT